MTEAKLRSCSMDIPNRDSIVFTRRETSGGTQPHNLAVFQLTSDVLKSAISAQESTHVY